MKRYGSIWMLAAQNTLWKLLLIWALTFLAELGLIVLAMGRLDYWDGLEYLVSESHAALAAGAGLLATCGVLALNGWWTALPAAAGIPCAGSVWTSGR